ncbi:MAG: DUF302 domain-containing protein [Kyrpidia tusciae]|nr:DUF302 domain-containing protein [Kyrpidia tusciae]MBE3553338.1 DUF302 domain-containing protein [Kyrpidia tusciae]
MFHYTVTTDKSLEESVRALEESLKERRFGVLWQMDIPEKLREKGVSFDTPYRVLEVCNPQEAARVLGKELLVGYFLPCKIVVYRDGEKTKIGLPRPTMLLGHASEDAELREIARRVEEQLTAAVDAAAR